MSDRRPPEPAEPAHEYGDEERARHVDADEPDQADVDRRRHEHLQDVAELLASDEGPAALSCVRTG